MNVAKLLIANGANVDSVDEHGHSPLHQAILFGKLYSHFQTKNRLKIKPQENFLSLYSES